MTRSLLRTLAWIFAAALLYGSVLLLEFYWNVLNWRPRWDGVAAGLLLGAVLGMAAMAWVAWRGFDALTRSVSFVTSVFLLAAALHALPPETVSEGFTGRETPSPIWYRGGRLLVFSAPIILWVWGWRRRAGNRREGPRL